MKTFKEFISEAKRKDETEEGITGLQIPRRNLGPRKRHEFEKKRRAARKERGDDRVGNTFSQYRMTGSRGSGSEYQVNPRQSYIRNQYEFDIEEEYKDLTPDKEERVKKRVGELARNVQLKSARVKELRNKPFAKFRPKIKKEIEANVKSAKKDANLVSNASDALIKTSIDRSAKIQKKIEDKKREI